MRFEWSEEGDGFFGLVHPDIAIAQQDCRARIAGLRFVERFELARGAREIALLVECKRQVQPDGGIGGVELESRAILRYCLIEPADVSERGAEIGHGIDGTRPELNQPAIIADGEVEITLLLGSYGLTEQLVRIRRLREDDAGEKRQASGRTHLPQNRMESLQGITLRVGYMKKAPAGIAILSLMLAGAAGAAAQTGFSTEFDDLAREATAALQSNPQEAIALYRKALALKPSWAEGWFYLGASLYGVNRYTESRDAFREAAKLAPGNGAVWGFLGLCENQTGEYRQALADIRRGEAAGLPDNPQFVSAVRKCGAFICIRASEFGAAMDQLQPLARAGDNSPEVIEAFGLSALGMPRAPAEIPAEKQALVQLAGRAAWALSAKREAEARSLFRELVTQYPNEPNVHYVYGFYLLESDPETALAEFERELQINPAHVPSRLQIALLDLKAGKSAAAAEMARAGLKLQPGNVFCELALGRALLSLGQTEEAIPVLESAVKGAPENAQTHFYLEQAFRRAGRTAEAHKEQAEFMRLKAAQDPLFLSADGYAALPAGGANGVAR